MHISSVALFLSKFFFVTYTNSDRFNHMDSVKASNYTQNKEVGKTWECDHLQQNTRFRLQHKKTHNQHLQKTIEPLDGGQFFITFNIHWHIYHSCWPAFLCSASPSGSIM